MTPEDLTPDICAILDAMLAPLAKRLVDAGVEAEQIYDVSNTMVEVIFRTIRVVGAASGIPVIEN